MTTVVSPQDRERSIDWLLNTFYRIADSKDLNAYIPLHSPDCEVAFGNAPPNKGREKLIPIWTEQFGLMESMIHKVTDVDVLPEKMMQSGTITYKVKDDPDPTEITVKVFVIFWKTPSEQQVRKLDIFADFGVVHQRMAAVAIAKEGKKEGMDKWMSPGTIKN